MLFSQTAGIRVFGGESRKHPIKSMKFYARKSYDKKNKIFAYNLFNAPRARGGYIHEYKRLVARNVRNDNQWAFIRDELTHTIARKAGIGIGEGVRPVVIYLNGQYYALHWLHETYCDDYFKDKYGDRTNPWFVLLIKQDWFHRLAAEKWTALSETNAVSGCIDQEISLMETYKKDFTSWKSSSVSSAYNVIVWLQKRLKWMDSQFLLPAAQ